MTVRTDWDARTFKFFREMTEVQSLLDVFSDPMQDSRNVAAFILSMDDLDDMSGEQLDHEGELIGVKRPMLQEDPDNIFKYRRLGYVRPPGVNTGFYNSADGTGGKLSSLEGLNSTTEPGEQISDADYRRLIKAKAKTFFLKMTDANLFTFLLTFGARCAINDDTAHTVVIEAAEHDDLNSWERWYASTKGFKPAGISVDFQSRMTHKDSI